MLPQAFTQTRSLGIALGALVVLAVAVDFAGLRPAAARIRRLEAQRAELAARVVTQSEQQRETEFLARELGSSGSTPGVQVEPVADPMTIVDGFIARRGLECTELASKPVDESGQVVRARLNTVVRGSFAQILGFVRDLEQGPRVITIDALWLEAIPGTARLEGRLSLSVYGPKQEGRP
jgi:Tfp pilus assembly protein PilO